MKKSLSILLLIFALSSNQNSYAMKVVSEQKNEQPDLLKSIWNGSVAGFKLVGRGVAAVDNGLTTVNNKIDTTVKFVKDTPKKINNYLWTKRYLASAIPAAVIGGGLLYGIYSIFPGSSTSNTSLLKYWPAVVKLAFSAYPFAKIYKGVLNYIERKHNEGLTNDPDHQLAEARKKLRSGKTQLVGLQIGNVNQAGNNYNNKKRELAELEKVTKTLDSEVNKKTIKPTSEYVSDLKKVTGANTVTVNY
ncbi:hypothetical protein KJ644_00600 [Candidatus Dependentiae bacterium]|nr:hypothetical protein [Candidatus Dependentiae bacterium]MBU4386954.1 hypothetical protein [Candidatus Dependentiae bacterium]MCG2756524.1 hypothetical protein [Candidatus Dependentiae bacterium]